MKKHIFRRVREKLVGGRRLSYSQCGEDIIISFLFRNLGIDKPTYIDIGAHDPIHISNTAYFYKHGSRGINIDANPTCMKKFGLSRRKDINLNVGIGASEKNEMPFYIMNAKTLSTFSKEDADNLVEKHGMKIKSIVNVPIYTIESIVNKYCSGVYPDLLTIDAEGMELDILKTMDFTRDTPKVICVETLAYDDDIKGFQQRKDHETIDFLISKGYEAYADTCINTIFVKI